MLFLCLLILELLSQGECCGLQPRLTKILFNFSGIILTRFQNVLCYELEWETRCPLVLDYPSSISRVHEYSI